jgi:hypothetical protein
MSPSRAARFIRSGTCRRAALLGPHGEPFTLKLAITRRAFVSDIGLSDLANLTRCKSAAREWAERKVVIEDQKTNTARRLKSLDNFSWSSSYIA